MNFVPLPFPECRQCGVAWVEAVHGDCGGAVEVEPWQEVVACKRCHDRWNLRQTLFACSCGARFSAAEVSSALDGLLQVCRRLAAEINENAERLVRIRRTSEASFRDWVKNLLGVLGSVGGFVVERMLRHFLPLP